MGLDYSYILYFHRDQMWNALQAVVGISAQHTPPTRILFPDHVLAVPLATWSSNDHQLQSDAAQLDFNISIYFDEDQAILDYLRLLGDEEILRSPPGSEHEHQISIGYIYLSIYQQIPEQPDSELVLFNFRTTGTRMSILFEESTSIRKTFTGLLEQVPGVCGVFNQELDGKLFWLKGQVYSVEIGNPYLLPDEIEAELKRS